MERSAIRGGIDASRQSRITLRSIRATAFHPPLQGEGRGPKGRGVGCAALPRAREPFNAVTPPAALRAIADASHRRSSYERRRPEAAFCSPSRGGGEISSPLSSSRKRWHACCGNESLWVKFVLRTKDGGRRPPFAPPPGEVGRFRLRCRRQERDGTRAAATNLCG